MKDDENPIYLKLEYMESLESKKDVLYSEMALLNLLRIIKKYNKKRSEELKIKLHAYKSLKELNMLIKKMRSLLPHVKIEEKEEKEEDITKKISTISRESRFDENLTSQLQEIQSKLDSLSQ